MSNKTGLRMKEVTVHTLSVSPIFSSDSKIYSRLWTFERQDENWAHGSNSFTDSWYHHKGALTENLELPLVVKNVFTFTQTEVHCHAYKNPTLVIIRRETFPVHHLLSTSLRRILILSTHQLSRLPSGRFPRSFPSEAHMHLSFLPSHPFISS